MATSHTSTRSLIAASAALLLTWSSGVMVMHPLSDPADHGAHGPAHCDHPQSLPLSHLFCRGWTVSMTDAEAPCPHDDATGAE